MAFEQQQNVTKIGIEDFEIRFFVPGPGNPDVQSGDLDYQILMSNGKIQAGPTIDLIARLPDTPEGVVFLQNLMDLRDHLRARLNAEALP